MTRSHLPPHRRRGGGTGAPNDGAGLTPWRWPLGCGAAAWGLVSALRLASTSASVGLEALPRLLVHLPLLLSVPLIAAFARPTTRRRRFTVAGHLSLAAGLATVSLLLSPAGAALERRGAAAVVGLVGYGLVLGATTLGWWQAERREWHRALARADDAAMRARLNPHFLFNTLHSLASMVRHDADTAGEAIAVLGDLLRYVLDADAAADVPLQREWAFVEGYLRLERLRLGDRLVVDLQVDPETLALPIPSLCVQPLVENAVRHGIGPQPAGGRVTVAVQLRRESLVIRVSDTGVGTDMAALASASGLGLRAIRQRIDNRFQGSARLELASSPGRGFTAELRLPVDHAPETKAPA